MNAIPQTKVRRGPEHPGPPLVVPAVAFAVIFVASLVVPVALGRGLLPSPFAGSNVIQNFFATSTQAVQITGFMQLLSALLLALFSAVAWSRLDYLAPNAPGPAIAGVGGMLAAIFLGLTAMFQWTLSQGAVLALSGLVRALHYLQFLFGGPAHTAGLGILVLGFAVTFWFVRRLPRWLCHVGFAIALLAMVSTLALLVPALAPLVALGRFGAILWLIAVAAQTPRTRRARGTTSA